MEDTMDPMWGTTHFALERSVESMGASESNSYDECADMPSALMLDRPKFFGFLGNSEVTLDMPEELEHTPFTCSNAHCHMPIEEQFEGVVEIKPRATECGRMPVTIVATPSTKSTPHVKSNRSIARHYVSFGMIAALMVTIALTSVLLHPGGAAKYWQANCQTWVLALQHGFTGIHVAKSSTNVSRFVVNHSLKARQPPGMNMNRTNFIDSTIANLQDLCNVTAPLPQTSIRKWDLKSSWTRVCEERNAQQLYPFERNWCWIGLKQMCHWTLKDHYSWSTIQYKAAKLGIAPPASDAEYHPLENPKLCDQPSNGKVRNWSQFEHLLAREWFKNNVAVYVLSLPTSENRWKMIHNRLKELDIWATRVPGVDMRVPGALWAAKKLGFVPNDFNFTHAQKTAYSWKHAMGSILGTLGCAAAHFKVQTKAIADGMPLALVLEDDSWPVIDFIPRLWDLVRHELPCDWEATALLSRCGYGKCISPHLMRVQPDPNEPAWRCHQGVNWGMHAMLYRTDTLPKLQAEWKKVVFDPERPRCLDVDVALASISDRVGFYAVPHVQDPGFVSETNHRSARWDINQEAASTTTLTTTMTTSLTTPSATAFIYYQRRKLNATSWS